ncbi:MAG: molybdopterin converting factor subunit 1 [Bacteroidetes bacterium]|nr:MAG: molybdopterin converting factor subunit 1 [Bacteroidota bacterium]
MNVTVKFFAIARDITGTPELTLEVPAGMAASELLDALESKYPGFGTWKSFVRVAVNREYVSNERILSAGDEIAIIPPVSGG